MGILEVVLEGIELFTHRFPIRYRFQQAYHFQHLLEKDQAVGPIVGYVREPERI